MEEGFFLESRVENFINMMYSDGQEVGETLIAFSIFILIRLVIHDDYRVYYMSGIPRRTDYVSGIVWHERHSFGEGLEVQQKVRQLPKGVGPPGARIFEADLV